MNKPKIPEVNLPYASTVASFFGDQGAAQGNSFLGKLFSGGSRAQQIQGGTKASTPSGSMANKAPSRIPENPRG